MTPTEFVDFAGKLAASGSGGEAAIRSAVSRAYYGAFHLTLQFLAELGVPTPANAASHVLIQHCMIGSGHAEAQRAGRLLSSLHTDRITADYRLSDTRIASFEAARMRVEMADTIRSILEACRHEPMRTELRSAINDYVRRN